MAQPGVTERLELTVAELDCADEAQQIQGRSGAWMAWSTCAQP